MAFILVRWLEEENLSVLQATAACPGDKVYVGAFGEYKWGGKYYEGEILGVSGKCLGLSHHAPRQPSLSLALSRENGWTKVDNPCALQKYY